MSGDVDVEIAKLKAEIEDIKKMTPKQHRDEMVDFFTKALKGK